MAKPLRSDDPNPQSVQFSHFGVLKDGQRSSKAAVTSIVINCSIAAVILILGVAVKNNPAVAKRVAALTLPPRPVEPPKPPPPAPKPPPPPLPKPPKIEEPKVEPPKPLPEPPKPVPTPQPTPKPTPTPPTPKPTPTPAKVALNNTPAPLRHEAPAAAKVNLNNASAASIPNNDAHPSAVRLGNTAVNPTGPAVATRVNLGGGMPGMSASNTGSGPHASSVNLGSGTPSGGTSGHSLAHVAGLGTGTEGSTGRGPAGPAHVALGGGMGPSSTPAARETARPASTAPTLVYKPEAQYTAEARTARVEGNVQVHIRVLPNGSAEFLSITHGLGYGLDEQARRVVQGMRFKPMPAEWTGDVIVRFQLN
ncbi:MAG: energy transducer TonB [Acidobacteriaceae bacterium]|nr:energy transducer TonB [Acidobacteriaceae bacterium]